MEAGAPTMGLTKEELLWRLWARAPQGATRVVTLNWLNDLLKDGLALNPIRIGNEGRRPRYRYDCKAYRRARQLLRFYRNGVSNRDDLAVLLFINGYGLEPALVRDAIAKVFRRFAVSTLSKVRSGYMGTDRNIGPSHAASILNKIGPVDQLMADAGVALNPEQLVEAARKIAGVEIDGAKLQFNEPIYELTTQLRGALISNAISMISGLFLISDQYSPYWSDGDVEGVIRSASDMQLLRARDFVTRAPLASGALFFLGNDPHGDKGLFVRQFNSLIRNSPELAAMLLIVGLREGAPKEGSHSLS